jgi:multiple sugar transport system permease protein
MILLLLIAIFPLIWSLYLSFTRYSVITDANTGPVWIGLQNYAELLRDPNIWGRFTTTARFVIPAVGIELLLGFALALLLNRNFKGRGLVMTLMLIPMMLSPVVVALFGALCCAPTRASSITTSATFSALRLFFGSPISR